MINAAMELLRAGKAHAAAAPRPMLLVQSAKLSGSRVLDGGFDVISYAAVVRKGNAEWLSAVNEFIEGAKPSGLMQKTIDSTGLRGVKVAPIGKPQ